MAQRISDHHRVQRSLQSLAIGFPQRAVARERELGRERLGEWEQQFQVPIGSDQVGPEIANTHFTLKFPYPFVQAQGQRDNLQKYPMFTSSWELIDGDPVHVTACVSRFAVSNRDESVTKARITVSVSAPFATVPSAGGDPNITAPNLRFNGFLHCVFQGWSAVANERKA